MKKSELKAIIRECIEEIIVDEQELDEADPKKIRNKWHTDYHSIPNNHTEVNPEDHGYEYNGGTTLKYLGVNSKNKRHIAKHMKSQEKSLRKRGYSKIKND